MIAQSTAVTRRTQDERQGKEPNRRGRSSRQVKAKNGCSLSSMICSRRFLRSMAVPSASASAVASPARAEQQTKARQADNEEKSDHERSPRAVSRRKLLSNRIHAAGTTSERKSEMKDVRERQTRTRSPREKEALPSRRSDLSSRQLTVVAVVAGGHLLELEVVRVAVLVVVVHAGAPLGALRMRVSQPHDTGQQ